MKTIRAWTISLLVFGACAAGQAATNGDAIEFRVIDDGNGPFSYVIHLYTSTAGGNFTPPNEIDVDYLVVAGGGGGGTRRGGGGGAGGVIINEGETIVVDNHEVIVGGGGAAGSKTGGTARGHNGGISSVFGAEALGGGGGAARATGLEDGLDGGSGGGARDATPGAGLQPLQPGKSEGFGNAGGTRATRGGGGGGAGTVGGTANGGIGKFVADLFPGVGEEGYVGGGGGGGGTTTSSGGTGGLGGGGDALSAFGEDGLPNTGGGGAGSNEDNRIGGNGGSGIVAIRYRLDDVDEWNNNNVFSVKGQVGRLLVEDTVDLRVPDGESLTIQTGGLLRLAAGSSLDLENNATLTVSSDAVLGGAGTIAGNLTLNSGARFVFNPDEILTVNGTINFNNLSIARLDGLTDEVELGTYTLIAGDSSTWDFLLMQNLGEANKVEIGESGKFAYFEEGSLQLVVIPEPHTIGLLLAAGALLALRRRARCLDE